MDLTKIFKSKTRKALFRLYFTNPEKMYYLRELERILEIPVSMLRKELLSLEKSSIFISQKKGNLTYYFVNKSYPLFEEFKSIVSKTVGVEGTLKTHLEKIKGISAAFIYGSYAKKQDVALSDIDLFILGTPNETKLISTINRIEPRLKREINYNLYTKKDFQKKKSDHDPFIEEVIREAKIFLIGDARAL